MNHIYSVLWNSALGRFCVTSELGRSRSRATTRRTGHTAAGWRPGLAALAAGVALAWSAPAWAQATLPQGGQVVGGNAAIGQSGQQMTVWQSSDKAIVNWQSFNIGASQQVTFQQPSPSAVALNRVIGTDPSAIHGSLQANGRVFLVNPNGMLFGAGANVNVGGLVASTLDIADHDFLQGRYQFSGQGSRIQGAALRNHGRITAADGGAVALLGGSVSNQGTISARLGTVALAAGNQVKLDFAGDGLLNVQVQQSSLDALVENQQLIQADGGSVLMTAKATDALLQTVVNNTGTVRARTVENRAGKIVLLGGFEGGTTRVAGTLDASAPDGGDGGFVDTSGAHVQIEAGTRVTTRASQGKTGTWLIDPTDFTIGAGSAVQTGSGIGAETLMANLADNNVTLQTVAAGTEAGDMHVNAAVSWNEHQLTLNAHRNINIKAVMSVNGNGKLALNYGDTQGYASATPVGDSNLNVNAGGRVDFSQTGSGLFSVNGHGYEVINNLQQLQAIGDSANLGGKYALGDSIDASATTGWNGGAGFAPIGGQEDAFTGVFDGLGHTVGNLAINRSNQNYVGLFGYARNATLRNISLEGGSVTGSSYVGMLAGINHADKGSALVSNAHTTGNVEARVNYAGGLVGMNLAEQGTASISQASAKGNIRAEGYAGGLVGANMIEQSYTSPASTDLSSKALISAAYATGQVYAKYEYAGGLAGLNSALVKFEAAPIILLPVTLFGTAAISNAYATGQVQTFAYAGGLVGANKAGMITTAALGFGAKGSEISSNAVVFNSYATGSVSAMYNAGGLAGANLVSNPSPPEGIKWSSTGTIANVYASGQVSATSAAGGIVGQNIGEYLGDASIFDAYGTGHAKAIGMGENDSKGKKAPQILTAEQMKQMASFSGWSISGEGGSNAVWRIYEGETAPLLRSFLKAVTIGGTATQDSPAKREYDGTNVFKVAHDHSADNQVLGELRYTVSSKDVGTHDAAGRGNGLYSSQQGYDISYAASKGSYVIEQKKISGTITADNKVYDRSAAAVIRQTGLAGVVAGEDVAIDQGSGRFEDWNAGIGKPVVAGGLYGKDAGNYQLVATATTADITPKSIIGKISAEDKIYDSKTNASITVLGLQGVLDGDTVFIDVEAGKFENKNAGIDKRVYADALTGEHAHNYTLDASQTRTTAKISKAKISEVTGITAQNRDYDSTKHVTLNHQEASFDGMFGADELSVASAKGEMLDKNAGDKKTVGISGITLGGADKDNYELVADTASTTVDIAKAKISAVTGITAQNRVYDGTERVALNHQEASFTGMFDGDALSVANASGKMVDKHVGMDKAVGITGITLGGDDKDNYKLVDTTASTKADIAKAQLANVGGITASNKTYDASQDAALDYTQATFQGILGDDELTVTKASGKFFDKNAGDAKRVDITGITLGGTDAGNYTLVDTTAQTKADISKAQLASVGGITASNKTYDASQDATLNYTQANFQGILGNDKLTVTKASGQFFDKNAGDSKRVDITGIQLGGTDAGNYTLVDTTAQTKADIAKAQLASVGGLTASNKTYDASQDATLNYTQATFQGILGNDKLTVTKASGQFLDKNAGDAKRVDITGIQLGGTDAGNYTLVDTTAQTTADISKAQLASVGGITASNKTYDASQDAALDYTQANFQGILGDDKLTVTKASGQFFDKNAGDSKRVDITGIQLGGTDAGNYTLVDTTAQTKADISKAELASVGGITANNKTYDTSQDATLNSTQATFQGILGGDELTVTKASGQFFDKNAGDAKRVDITGIQLGGVDAHNYTLVDTTAQTQADIAKAQLASVGGLTANNKTYDASQDATLNYTQANFQGILGGDELTVTKASGKFFDKNAGDSKRVDITGIQLGGTDAGNYTLVDTTAQTKADIAKAQLASVGGITANNKTYDASQDATLNYTQAIFQGILGDDELTVTKASGKFFDKNAGDAKRVDITGITLGGVDAGNYTLVDTTAQTKADISKAQLASVGGITANNKTYDTSQDAALNYTQANFQGILGNDELTVTKASGQFFDKNAGDSKRVDITGIQLGGTDAGNYTLVDTTAQTKADIAKAQLASVGGITANNKTYDASQDATLNYTKANFQGILGDDKLTVTKASGQFFDKNAGDSKRVDITGIQLGGTDAGNYTLVDTTAQTNADIAKAQLTSVGGLTASNKTYDASQDATLNYTQATFQGILGDDKLTVTKASGQFFDKNAGDAKRVDITGITLGGVDAGNYTLVDTTAQTKADIAKAQLASVGGITASNKTYDASQDATLNYTQATFQGILGDDKLTVTKASGQFLDKNAGDSKRVDITGIQLGGVDAGNYTLVNDSAAATATIDQRAIEVQIGASNKTYDANEAAITHGVLGRTVLGDDQLTLTTSGLFADKNAGTDKIVNVSGTLTGADAGNYRLVHNDTAKADIAQLALEARIGADGKTYDATRSANTHGKLDAVLRDDEVTLTTSGLFVDKNAGTDKVVNVSGTLTGADAGNYRLVSNATTTATIDQRAIEVAITADGKTYDATTRATTHGSLGDSILHGDTVTLATSGAFGDKKAGLNKQVDVVGKLAGDDAGNYRLVHNETTTAAVDQRAIEVQIGAGNKTYDATTAAITSGGLGNAILDNDQVTLATAGRFADKNAGTDKTVHVSGALAGADAGNYRLVHNETTTADINQLAIRASIAADDKEYDGSTVATTHGALTGVLAGDSVALHTRGSFLDPAAGAGKLVEVRGTLDGEDAGNYRLEHDASTRAAIHPVAATTPAVLTDVYDGAYPARVEVPRPEASASFNGCLGDVYPMPALVMNLGGLAAAAAQQPSQPAIVFARLGAASSDRACARTPF